MLVVSDVPDLDAQVISAENVVVRSWRILGPRNRVDDFCEKMLPRRVLLHLENYRRFLKLARYAQVALAHVPL
jgi:hypothetical protein